MRSRVRAFVAILLSEEVRAVVAAGIARLQPLARSVRWVSPENLHLTLRFLGERTPEELDLVRDGLSEVVEGAAPFVLSFHGLGAFPGLARPRVFWVGVTTGGEDAKQLHARLDAALARRTIPPDERPFSPHLTIGRARTPTHLPAVQEAIAREGQRGFGELHVGAISLMQSELTPAGPRYTELKAFPFGLA